MFYKQFFHMLIELNKIACICLKSFKFAFTMALYEIY